jgi:hypothetical protein
MTEATEHRHGQTIHVGIGTLGHRHGTMTLGSKRPTKLGPPAEAVRSTNYGGVAQGETDAGAEGQRDG